uniref:Uncharacterized protein n=1 Tax=Siphoviridae sp. ctCS019 TaxID=2825378 RepID=A0A8S5U5I6_9CAUD|nr:MAG TPA: hypothetical protein [Siphoviridae sp. ctCS019]
MGVNTLELKYPTPINIGELTMIQVPNNVVTDLVRHIPMILELLPDNTSTRVYNAVRLTKKNIQKLKKLSDEQRNKNG